VLSVLATVVGAVAIVTTLLPLSRSKVWWVRIWDFPRLQLFILSLVALVIWSVSAHPLVWPQNLFTFALTAVAVYQAALVWRYTPLAPREVLQSRSSDPLGHLSLVVVNILQTNRQSDMVLSEIRDANPDLVLFCEVDKWWVSRLEALATSHQYSIEHPLSNTYGLLLRSRLELSEAVVSFLVKPDNPSIHAKVVLRNGVLVWLHCVHPPPPVPGESDESSERDSALLKVGRRVSEATGPVVVCGDLNDVAWSRSTRLFQKISGLLEPRKGRGFVSTFHARYPGFRVPIDHVFHSKHFRLVHMRRLNYVGSDHFPVHIVLSYEPDAVSQQDPPHPSAADRVEARETLAESAPSAGS
jgi:endonuclease/exonuclease/phosphatase (EEP) superfamily protein YafD